jgi:hypothetical protein
MDDDLDDRDLLKRIRRAQVYAMEAAVLTGSNLQMASIMAGEQVVIEDLRRKEAERLKATPAESNVIDFFTRKPKPL